MTKLCLSLLAAVVTIFVVSSNSQALMTRVSLDGWTQNETDPKYQQMQLYIQVSDWTYSRGPDFVKAIKVKAPDDSQFVLDPKKDWLHVDNAYWKPLYASDFKGQKIIGGTYYVTVYPFTGSPITESDSVIASFLAVSSITFPSEGSTVSSQTPTFKWTSVAGAAYYRLLLWDNSWNEPVYWTFGPQMRTDFTYFTFPPGVLKPERSYRFRIEARAASQDLDMRSRSLWINFQTGSW